MVTCFSSEYKYHRLTDSVMNFTSNSAKELNTTMQASKLIIVSLALCLATLAVAFDTPAKPNPATEFTLSTFAVTDNGKMAARVYYDQANQRVRTDTLDKDFNSIGEFIATWSNNKAFWYDSNSGQCSVYGLDSKWTNAWSFLDDAVYIGEDHYIGDQECDLWVAPVGDDTIGACFTNNEPVFLISYNGTQVTGLYVVSNFVPSVDPAVFTAPSSCDGSVFKFSARPFMNLKRFKVPEHPLFF